MLYQSHAVVHLNNIRNNIEGIRKSIGPDRKILIAVKANAYGHGSVEVSRMAEEAGVNWLGVATVPEGIELRKAGITLPILKFSPVFSEEIEAALEYDITLAVCDRHITGFINDKAAAAGKTVSVHMKVDTGMFRVGVSTDEAAVLAHYIENDCSHLDLEGVFTHLPVSDSADLEYTKEQIGLFSRVMKDITESIGRKPDLVHCSNSGAVLGHPEGYFDMVRPGIMIYGYYPDSGTPRTITLYPGMSFKTRISFIKKVKAGTKVSYGRTWSAVKDTWIATIPVGYADGFNRLFSNKGRILVNGNSYPIAGRVCMDQCMVDLGPETEVCSGDEVVLIGRSGNAEISCYEWAEKLGTIPYEVTCNIGPRVQRIFD